MQECDIVYTKSPYNCSLQDVSKLTVSINTLSSTMTSSKAKQNLFSVMIKKLDWQYDEIIKTQYQRRHVSVYQGIFIFLFIFQH